MWCEEVLANTMVVIILQYVSVSNPHIAHLNLYNVSYKLHLRKTGNKEEKGKKEKKIAIASWYLKTGRDRNPTPHD